MDYRDVVVALTDLTPETKREALEQLKAATTEELDGLAFFLARLLSIDTGRTVGVWAVGALVALWREQIEEDVADADDLPLTELSWPVIDAVRERCLPILFELRTTWFGWNEWDDALIIAPLAAIERDEWFDAATNVLFGMSTRTTPASTEASAMLGRWFPHQTASERALAQPTT